MEEPSSFLNFRKQFLSNKMDVDLSKVIYRPATLDDYAGVLAISQNVYDGADYLPQQYHMLYNDPHSNFFVAEYKGQIVSIICFLK